MELKTGTEIAARYRVERILNDDNGVVLLATREAQNGLLVAVKVFPAAVSQEKLISRFRRAQHIDSPLVPKLFELGGLDDGRTFIAVEYLSGRPLSERADRGPLPIGEAAEYVRQASEAVAAAHRAGIVHRRLSTAKLFEVRKGQRTAELRVLGFATSLPAEPTTGELPHDLDYLAPEQLSGVGNGDRAADVWALGAILYHLLTGRLPFTALTRSATAKLIRNDNPKPPRALRSDIPWQLEQTILRCLDKNPAARLESAEALSSALAEIATPIAAVAPSSIPPPRQRISPSAPPPLVVRTPTELPDVTKLSHVLTGEPKGTVERTPDFHRLRSDGRIEGVKVDDVVEMARTRRNESDAARHRVPVQPSVGTSIPPTSRPALSSRPAAPSSPPPANVRNPLSTAQVVAILLIGAVVLGLGCGLLVRAILP